MKENKLKGFLWSLLSRKLILALLGAVVAFGNSFYDWGITTEELWMILTPLMSFIGVEGIKDIMEAG